MLVLYTGYRNFLISKRAIGEQSNKPSITQCMQLTEGWWSEPFLARFNLHKNKSSESRVTKKHSNFKV